MVFSTTASWFFHALIDYVEQNHKKDLGFFLREIQLDLAPNSTDHRKYASLLREILSKYQFNIPPDDHPALLSLVWEVTEPNDRRRAVCCRDHLVRTMALAYVKTYEKMWPATVGTMLSEVYASTNFPLFKPLGRMLIEKGIDRMACEDRTNLDLAWECVRGAQPPLVWADEPECLLSDEDDELEAQLERAAAESMKEAEALSTPLFADLQKLCFEEYIGEYGNVLERPYMCLYEHPGYGRMVVFCSIGGINSKGQKVYAGAKYGTDGGEETTHKNMSESPWTLWGTTYRNAKTCIRALPYVEGGYGKYWINVKDPSKKHNDILQAFFVLRNHKIKLVSEKVYEHHKKMTGEKSISFDVVA